MVRTSSSRAKRGKSSPPPSKAKAPAAKEPIIVQPVIGHRVEFCLDSSGPCYGTIIHIEPDACIVRLEKNRYGERGRDDQDAEWVAALDWDEVLLTNVRPLRS